MAVSPPIVAVPSYRLAPGRVSEWRDGAFALPGAYAAAIRRAGGIPVVLAPPGDVSGGGVRDEAWTVAPETAEEILCRVDALVLIGGGDVEPALYGLDARDEVSWVDEGRDMLEMGLALGAARCGVATLAICRGMQVLNVALGGTLHQHLPDDGPVRHGRDEEAVHPVRVEQESLLAGACGGSIERCVSRHHQGLDRLGEGLAPVAWSHDGLVEAVERPAADGWMLGVQWHPERSASHDPVQQRLFDALVRNAGRRPGSLEP